MNRDEIDFGSGDVRRTFLKMLWPTLVGMISMVVLNLTDGAFVGHGVGSDALAAINIVAPGCFLLPGGVVLMFGMGASVVASVHMSQGKQKAANINITQAIIGAELFAVLLSALMLVFPEQSCRLFGSSDQLLPQAIDYMWWVALLLPLGSLASVGLFIIRLDGNPKLAMWIMTGAALCNMFFDWLLIFPLQMGIKGAAIATSGSFAVGGLVTLVYLLCYARTVRLYRLKLSAKSLKLMLRNLWYQMRLGSSAFFGEAAIAFVMVVGNFVFIERLGEDGVAAFSLACYCFPVVFSIGNAIVVSAQPLISFAHGAGNTQRMHHALRLAIVSALIVGVLGILLMSAGAQVVTGLFLAPGCHAYDLALTGLPVFSIGFLFIALNLVAVGYLQSIERGRQAAVVTILRGYLLLIIAFVVLPPLFGVTGIWAAMPVAEALTCVYALFCLGKK